MTWEHFSLRMFEIPSRPILSTESGPATFPRPISEQEESAFVLTISCPLQYHNKNQIGVRRVSLKRKGRAEKPVGMIFLALFQSPSHRLTLWKMKECALFEWEWFTLG